jgi:hypothetical protein
MNETKEALVGLLAITELLASEFKDGVQAADVADIILKITANDDLKKKLLDAYNGIDKVPAEVKDMDIAEAVELLTFATPKILDVIKAIKK